MSQDIFELEDIHKGETVVICGHGPSLNKVINEIEEKQSNNGIRRISTNGYWNFFTKSPDYYFICNPHSSAPEVFEATSGLGMKCPHVIDCDFFINRPPRPPLINGVKISTYNLFQKATPENPNFINYVSKKFNEDPWPDGGWLTSLFVAIDFAFFCGFSKILIAGMDLDWNIGYANVTSYDYLPDGAIIDNSGSIQADWHEGGPKLDNSSQGYDPDRVIKPISHFVKRSKKVDSQFGWLGDQVPWYAKESGLEKIIL